MKKISRKNSLKQKIFLISSIFIALMAIIFCTYFSFTLYNLSFRFTSGSMSLISSQFEEAFQQFFKKEASPPWLDEVVETYRYAIAFNNFDQLNKLISQIIEKDTLAGNVPVLKNVAIYSSDGKTLVSSDENIFLPYFKSLNLKENLSIQYLDPLQCFVLVCKIQNELKPGLLVAQLNNDIFTKILSAYNSVFSTQLGYDTATTYLLIPHTDRVFFSGSGDIKSAVLKSIPEKQTRLDSGHLLYKTSFSCDGIDRLILVAAIPRSDVMKDTFHMLAISSLGIALIFLIGFFLINYYSNRLLIKPLSILNQASAQIAEGHLEHEIPIESNDEIGRLADTFRKMGSSIKQGIDTLEQQVLKRTKELKKTNEELLIAEEEAAKANMAKTRFLANMSHEIRTPLNAIIGFTNILQKEGKTTQLPGKFYEYMEHINISGHNLAELINNILDLSKIESGKMNVVQETINLHLLIQGIFHVNKAHAMKNSVVLNYSISDELPTFVNTDRTKLNQILMNLTSNAIKFTPPGKRVTIIAKMEQTRILIQVMDEGIGIPRQKHQTIFEAFEQADDSTTRCYGGTGLGLPIVKQLTELLGGEILLNSKEGEGSCFSVHLPCDIAEDHTAPEVVNLDNVTFSSSLKLLLVEDNTNNQKFMTELLSLYGLNIILAENGKDGVEKCRYHKPDLILMDMHMPVMDGLEASKLILSAPESSDIPIIMLSADVFAEQKQAALDAGISDYLLKPVQTPELLRTLLKYLPAQETIPEENPLPVDSKICDSDFIEKMKIILAIPEYKTSLLLTSVNEILESYPQGCVEFSLMKQYKELIIFKKDSDAKELIKEFLNG